jgi:hypothetical protein
VAAIDSTMSVGIDAFRERYLPFGAAVHRRQILMSGGDRVDLFEYSFHGEFSARVSWKASAHRPRPIVGKFPCTKNVYNTDELLGEATSS